VYQYKNNMGAINWKSDDKFANEKEVKQFLINNRLYGAKLNEILFTHIFEFASIADYEEYGRQ
jgi:hypothetical protein